MRRAFTYKATDTRFRLYFFGIKILSIAMPSARNEEAESREKLIQEAKIKGFDLFKGMASKEKETCIIMGNGPSLGEALKNDVELAFIKQHPIFCVNAMPATKEFFSLKPSYVVFADPVFWTNENMDEARCNSVEALCQNTYNGLLKVDWKLTIFMPKEAEGIHYFVKIPELNKNVTLKYFNSQRAFFQDERKFDEYKYNLAAPALWNVLIGAIYIAITAGYKNIYVYGLDFSYFKDYFVIDEQNNLYMKQLHFYDSDEVSSALQLLGNRCLAAFLGGLKVVFEEFTDVGSYAESVGTNVYNKNIESYVDAFKKVGLGEKPE